MTSTMTKALASLAVAGAMIGVSAPAAFAGADEAQINSFWRSSQGQASTAAPSQQYNPSADGYRATYNDPDASYAQPTAGHRRKARAVPDVAPVAPPVPKDPPYYYHSMGTMGTP